MTSLGIGLGLTALRVGGGPDPDEGNLVVNGSFSDGTTGWLGNQNATLSNTSGQLIVTNSTSGIADVRAGTSDGFPTVIGQTYSYAADYVSSDSSFSGSVIFAVGNAPTGSTVKSQSVAAGNSVSFTFTATATTTYAFAASPNVDRDEFYVIDNIFVEAI